MRKIFSTTVFGLKGRLGPDVANEMTSYMMQCHVYGRDEEFLDKCVFPRIKDDCLFHCQGEGWFGESRNQLTNPYEFVGNGWDEEDLPLYGPGGSAQAGVDEDRIKHRFSSYRRARD